MVAIPDAKSTAKKNTWIPENELGIARFAQIPPHIFLDKRVSAPLLHVFCLMCLHARLNGSCYMSQERLAELAGYSLNGQPNRQHVSRLISRLEKLGYVKNYGQRGLNKTNFYRLAVPAGADNFRVATNRQLSDDDYFEAQQLKAVQSQGFASVVELLASIENYDAQKDDGPITIALEDYLNECI